MFGNIGKYLKMSGNIPGNVWKRWDILGCSVIIGKVWNFFCKILSKFHMEKIENV